MSDEFTGQTLAEKYRIEEPLRENGLGKLYHATHLLMEKPVCVKILAPEFANDDALVKRFSSEAKIVSRIAHPNILNVTDFGTDKDGAVFTVFENADGKTLKDAIGSERKFSYERAVRVIQQIAAALAAAHNNGVVHSHLNGENILLAKTAGGAETVKILDFGSIEKPRQDDEVNEIPAKNFEYLAPEQNSSGASADERSDVYSLGVIFYEMLTGEMPFKAESVEELERKLSENPPAPISSFRSDLPDGIGFIVLKALSRNPDMRYQSIREFADDLNRVVTNFGETETIVIPRADDTARNNMWKTAFVVLAGISLLAIGLIYATSVKQTSVQTQMQTDANGQPVQPINPATGMNEQGLSNMMPGATTGLTGNPADIMNVPQPVQGASGDGYGDNYNPWARGGQPPPGAPPQYIPPGGQMIDPNNPNSIFMQDGVIYQQIPVPANANSNTGVKPTPTPGGKASPTPAPPNAQPSPTPKDNKQTTPPADAKPTPAPKTEKTPEKPKTNPPAATEKAKQSGKEQDS